MHKHKEQDAEATDNRSWWLDHQQCMLAWSLGGPGKGTVRTPSPGMSASVSLDLARRRHPLLSRTSPLPVSFLPIHCSYWWSIIIGRSVQKAAAAGTERSSLLHARLGGAASGCIAVQPASDEPVSHAPAVTDFSVKSLPCCAAMPGNVLIRRYCIVHWVWHSYKGSVWFAP